MSTVNSAFKKSDSMLSVTLSSSGLTKDGEHVGRVTRNTVTTENIIAEIIDDNSGLDPFTIQHSVNLYKQAVLKMLRQGKSINILELGIMYIAMKGMVKGDTPDAADLPKLLVKFTPSALVDEAVENIVIDKIVFSDTAPQIDVITDLWSGKEDDSLTLGKPCRIKGDKLKLGGNDFSLTFVPVDENGDEVQGGKILELPANRLFKNTSTALEFFVPEDLENGKKYIIRLKTSYLSAKTSRKTPVITDSDPITIGKVTEEAPVPEV